MFVVSACFTAWFLAQGVWSLTLEPHAPAMPNYSTAHLPAVQEQAISTKAILRRNLMQLTLLANSPASSASSNDRAVVSSLESTDSIPISKLGWQLLGTVASNRAAESHAALVIDGKQQLLREGERVNGWLIERVLRKTVILRKDAVRERLVLVVPQQNSASSVPPNTGQPTPAGTASSTNRPNLATLNPAALMREVALKPKSLGTRQGMEITALLSESPLHALGLRTGDVVLSVNGQPTRSYDDLPAILNALQADRIQVEVSRLGKNITLE